LCLLKTYDIMYKSNKKYYYEVIVIKNFDDIFRLAKEKKSTIAVGGVASVGTLETADEAVKLGIASMILVGDEEKIRAMAAEASIDLAPFEIVHEADPAAACQKAVGLVNSGRATALMKGDVDTSVVMRAVLCRETGMRDGKKLTHIAAFEAEHYHKLMFATDCAIIPNPDFDTKVEIIESTVQALRNMGIANPKVALIAAKEKVDKNMPITEEYAEIVALHKSGARMQNCIVDGPLALDNAVSHESCQIKGINSPVGGDADIFLMPDIEAGNVFYKAMSFITKAKNGGVVVGAKRPVILTSRADSSESKLISIALSVIF